MTQIDISDLINLTKAARFLDVSYVTIHRWIKSGKLQPRRIGGMPFIPLGDLVLLKNQRDDNNNPPL